MTNAEMKARIERSAKDERDAGGTVEINETLPYVAIKMPDDSEYFFQEHEASELLEEHNTSADKFDVSVEDSILHSAQGW